MNDQIIDAAMAQGLHIDACRSRQLVGWVVMQDPPDYPDKFTARLATDVLTPYVLVADSLAELQAMLPPRLARTEWHSADMPEVIEIWFAK